MDQSVKVRLNEGKTRNMKIGRGVRQGCSVTDSTQLTQRAPWQEIS
jgi:hypothetical protein